MRRIVLIFGACVGALAGRAAGAPAEQEEIYCRYMDDSGEARYGRVEDSVVRALDAAPWAGGRVTGRSASLKDVRLLPPSEPRSILGLAGAYVKADANPPKTVRWFAKSASAAAADGEAIPLPAALDAVKCEVELVIVIGRRVRNATEEEAAEAIFGYTTGTEIFGFVESYHRENGEDPARAEAMLGPGLKLGDKFAPFGPFIHRGVEWRGRARTLAIRSPSGRIKADYRDSTDGLHYPPEKIVSDLSRVQTLEPGDVIFSGTNQAFTATAGDTVVTEVEGLGRLNNRIVGAGR